MDEGIRKAFASLLEERERRVPIVGAIGLLESHGFYQNDEEAQGRLSAIRAAAKTILADPRIQELLKLTLQHRQMEALSNALGHGMPDAPNFYSPLSWNEFFAEKTKVSKRIDELQSEVTPELHALRIFKHMLGEKGAEPDHETVLLPELPPLLTPLRGREKLGG